MRKTLINFELRRRSVLKSVSYQLLSNVMMSLLVWAVFGQWQLAVFVGVIELFIKVIMYFAHERVWNRISFGKRTVPPFVVWLTGLSGSGKTTLSQRLFNDLLDAGLTVEHLDGDVIRKLFSDTGFSKEDRDFHIRRVGLLASMLERNGVVVLCSFISPYEEARNFVRGLCQNYCEVYVKAPLDVCEKRDVKGLYKRARAGQIKGFTGIDDPYEEPRDPEITVYTDRQTVDESLAEIHKFLKRRYLKF